MLLQEWMKFYGLGVKGNPYYPDREPEPQGGTVFRHRRDTDEMTWLVGFEDTSSARWTMSAVAAYGREVWPDVCPPADDPPVASASGRGGELELVPAACEHCAGHEAYVVRWVEPPTLLLCLTCTLDKAREIAERLVTGTLMVHRNRPRAPVPFKEWMKTHGLMVKGDPYYPDRESPPEGGGIVCKYDYGTDETTELVWLADAHDARWFLGAIACNVFELWPDVCPPADVPPAATASGQGGEIELVPAACEHCAGREAYVVRRVQPPGLLFCLTCTLDKAKEFAEKLVAGKLRIPPSQVRNPANR